MNYAASHSPAGVPDDVLDTAFRIPHDNPPRWLLVITAYIDETGQEQTDWMCVAGFMGDDNAWGGFLPEWKRAIFPRPHLHMKELRFNKDSQRVMLEKAALVPKELGLIPVFGGCRAADFADMVQGTGRERLLSGYIMCCTALVLQVLLQLPEGERFKIVFERQDRYATFADIAMRAIASAPELRMADGRGKLASWRFISTQENPEVPPEISLTEPADYLAYAFRQMWRDPKSIKAQWCKPILEAFNFEGVGVTMPRDMIRKIITDAVVTLSGKGDL